MRDPIDRWWTGRAVVLAEALAPAGALALAGALLATPSAGETLAGRLILAGKADMAGAVVYYTPETPVPIEPPRESFRVVTARKAFTPRVLAVPVGSAVRFPNDDPILHNVFSVSGKNRFDLGLYRRGEGGEVTFDEPGVVRVFCNVHHAMVAYVVVLETPFYVRPDADGGFRLEGLPAGRGELTAWHERAEPYSRTVELPHEKPLEIVLEVSRPRVPRHLNKLGKPYSNSRGRRYDN